MELNFNFDRCGKCIKSMVVTDGNYKSFLRVFEEKMENINVIRYAILETSTIYSSSECLEYFKKTDDKSEVEAYITKFTNWAKDMSYPLKDFKDK